MDALHAGNNTDAISTLHEGLRKCEAAGIHNGSELINLLQLLATAYANQESTPATNGSIVDATTKILAIDKSNIKAFLRRSKAYLADNQVEKVSLRTYSLTFTQLLTHLLTLTHSLTYSLTHSPTHSLLLAHLLILTHSLTHSLTHLLTHLLTYSLTHLLTYSLTHLFHTTL